MATKKTVKKETNTEKLSDIAKDLYLANLGMYGKIYETLEEKVEEISDKREDLFKELVKRGEQVHKTAEKRIKDVQKDAEKRLKGAQKDAEKFIKEFDLTKDMKLEDRIKELRSNFSSVKAKLIPGSIKKKVSTEAKAKAPTKAKAKATASKVTNAAKQAAAEVTA
jgi:ElaB/YqjD/DUF883 family membrane-anchored ribosome-binding protein